MSRLIVIAGVYGLSILDAMQRQQRGLPIARSTRRLIERHFMQWDGRWYKLIADRGYQADLPERISYIPDNGGATVAFFPLYPYLARWFDYVFPGGIDQAMLGLNVVLSAVAVVLVGLLAREVFDIETAERAMILFCLFPGAVVMSWAYSEPTLVVCSAACLLFLMKERWLLAGIAAALGTATRPNGVALVVACAVAAGIAIYTKRQWRSLIAVALSPLGGVAFFVYLRVHTGESNAWDRAQKDAWGESWSWGATAVRYVWRFFENPLGTGFGALYMHTTLAHRGVRVRAVLRDPEATSLAVARVRGRDRDHDGRPEDRVGAATFRLDCIPARHRRRRMVAAQVARCVGSAGDRVCRVARRVLGALRRMGDHPVSARRCPHCPFRAGWQGG